MAGEEPKRTPGTGTVIDPGPRVVPVTPETQVQTDKPGPPVCVTPTAIDRYALKEEVGRGGMGSVFYARDMVLHRDVAVKVMHDRFRAAGSTAARFVEEARITGQLQHPGIPPVHDLGTLPDGRPFIAMKLIRGRTLAALLSGPNKPDLARLLADFQKICEAVAYAHAKHVIHRDLKSGNVMVGAFGEVQVMDWGLAKVLSEEAIRATESEHARSEPTEDSDPIQSERTPETQTQAGSSIGTPAFMPPEQARGELHRIGPRSDVFCLGGILCELLTGKPPYYGPVAEVRAKAALGQLDEAYARLDRSGADPEVIALAKGCLSPEPASRPADAGAVAGAVAAYREGLDSRLRKAEVDRAKAETQAAESHKRARLRLVLAGLGLVTVAVATVYNFRLGKANEDTRIANEAAKENNALTESAIDQFVAGLSGENEYKLKKYDDLRDVRRKLLETAVDFNKKLLVRGGDEERLRYKRADVHLTLGLLYAELEDPDQSAAESREAKALFAELSADPNDDRALAGLASAANRLGNALELIARRDKSDFAPAAREYDEAIRLRRTLVDRNAAVDHKIDLATSLSNLAGLCAVRPELVAGRSEPAVVFREAETILRPIVLSTEPPLRAERQFAKLETNFATLLHDRKDPSFVKALETAQETFERIVGRYPSRDDLRFEYVRFAYKVANWWYDWEKVVDAERWMLVAAAECGRVVDSHPGVGMYRMWYAEILLARAVFGNEVPGRPRDAAVPHFQAALEQLRRLTRDRPGQRDAADMGLDLCERLAVVLATAGRHADAVGVWDEAATFAPDERKRGIGFRRELARARSGEVAAAVTATRALAAATLKSAEEVGFYAAVLATAAAATRDDKPILPAEEIDRLRTEVKELVTRVKGLPDYPKVRVELADIAPLKPFLGS